jgi:hypothetical protein
MKTINSFSGKKGSAFATLNKTIFRERVPDFKGGLFQGYTHRDRERNPIRVVNLQVPWKNPTQEPNITKSASWSHKKSGVFVRFRLHACLIQIQPLAHMTLFQQTGMCAQHAQKYKHLLPGLQ